MRYLRTNTACRVTVGPFFDKTDGVTPETALTVTSCKLTLMVDDGNVPTLVLDANPTASGGANDMVHVAGDDAGFYDLELAAGNVNYLGRAMLAITDAATHCPVFHEFMILPAKVYDSLVLGSDNLEVDLAQSLGVAITNEDFTIASATSTTVTLPTTYSGGGSLPDDGRYVDCALQVTAGTGEGQVVLLTTAGAGARQYNVVSGTMPTPLDSTSKCIVLGPTAAWLLKRSIAVSAANPSRTVGEALAAVRNKWTSVGGTYTVYDTDDTTVIWTSTLSGDTNAQPVIGSDPS